MVQTENRYFAGTGIRGLDPRSMKIGSPRKLSHAHYLEL